MPEEGFRDLELRIAYARPDDPLHRFYIPVLSRAVHYDRSAGYFSSGALVVAAQGLAHLIRNGGAMRLLAGAQLSRSDVGAIREGASLDDITVERLVDLLSEPEDELAKRRLEALAWMVAAGTLEIKVVVPRDADGRPIRAPEADAYYHTKKGLFTDPFGDRVGFSGSVNETIAGWDRHFEEFHVFRSWEQGERPHVAQVEAYFSRVWENRDPDWISLPIPEAAKERLLMFRPEGPPDRDPLEAWEEAPVPMPTPSVEEAIISRFLRDVPHLLDIGERIGRATAAIQPWPHQLRVAAQVVESFPERFLLADEVGLGKTIEAGLVLRDLLVSGTVERCLILAPASVLRQWQDELKEKFALEVPISDGVKAIGPGPDHVERDLLGPNPWDETAVVLSSSQLVKRRDRRGQLLSAGDWDLVVVDEAHHARRKDFQDLTVRRPNRLLELLEGTEGLPGLADKTRSLLLLTATPMQVHAVEVWDLLLQLGLAGRWGAWEGNFIRYFDELRTAASNPPDADWRFLAGMARDEFEHGGEVSDEITSIFEDKLGAAARMRVQDFPFVSDPRQTALSMSNGERQALLALLRHLTPLRRRMFRHTRNLLRRYRDRGLLPGKIADREPDARWIAMTPEEGELYGRVEEYISSFYRKYEGERKGLGFVMTVYRRRLTSSFHALRLSLEKRLHYLRGLSSDLGLTDEDLEDADLSEDIAEELGGFEGRQVRSIHAEEIGYVEDFVTALRNLGSDTKFDQLVRDLDLALQKRDSVVLFTQYVDTMDDLKEKLRQVYGKRLACYSGRGGEWWTGVAWAPASKEEIKKSFRDGNVQILLGTDALAEGLNLQTCGVEINYDAPWNPMRLEQRIGRIDRIGQQHDVVWIWTYFYEDTVEAQVYERLGLRINWFKGVVGPLQPILNRVERTIRDLALEDPEVRKQRLASELTSLEEEIDRVRHEGFDLDAFLDERMEAPPAMERPATWEDLELFLTGLPTLGHRFRPHPEIPGAFLVSVEGEDIGMTFDPGNVDEHPDSLRLLTFGDRVFEELLAAAGVEGLSSEKFIRVSSADSPRRWVGWYRPDGEGVRRVEALTELRMGLAESTTVGEASVAQAEEEFALALIHRLENERQVAGRRAEERLSAVMERGRQTLARATYVWSARKGDQVGGSITEMTMRSVTMTEGYPLSALGTIVETLPSVSKESREWAELGSKNRKQLDGLWQATLAAADRLVSQITEAKALVDSSSVPPIIPKIESAVL